MTALFPYIKDSILCVFQEFIINWDPKARTALSDIEVIHKDVEGAFYHMNYLLEDGSRSLEVATTRPETMFGDTAVAVHPNDERYKDLIGQNVILPIVNKLIPIVADEHADPEFGTGVVKITPAHDPNDFLVGQRHNLPQVNVMNDDGTMNELAGEFAGMDRFEARKAVVKKLEEIGALVSIEKMVHSVGHSAAIHTKDEDLAKRFGTEIKAMRIIWNSPSTFGGIGDVYNAFIPSLTLGCGSYGHNSVGDNVSAINIQNIQGQRY